MDTSKTRFLTELNIHLLQNRNTSKADIETVLSKFHFKICLFINEAGAQRIWRLQQSE